MHLHLVAIGHLGPLARPHGGDLQLGGRGDRQLDRIGGLGLPTGRALGGGRDDRVGVAVLRRLAHRHQIDHEHQGLVGADALGDVAVDPVGLGGGDGELPTPTHAELGQAGLEAGDQLPLPELGGDGSVFVEGVHEHRAVGRLGAHHVEREVGLRLRLARLLTGGLQVLLHQLLHRIGGGHLGGGGLAVDLEHAAPETVLHHRALQGVGGVVAAGAEEQGGGHGQRDGPAHRGSEHGREPYPTGLVEPDRPAATDRRRPPPELATAVRPAARPWPCAYPPPTT